MARGRTCAICADPARRLAVDSALATGSTVAEVVRLYGETLNVGLGSCYRHARHSNDRAAAFSVPVPEGERPSDLLRALLLVQRTQLAALERADAKQDDKTSAVAADRVRSVTRELVDLAGVDAVGVLESLDLAEGLVRGIRRSALADPAVATDLAAAFRAVGDDHNADQLDELAEYATARNNRTAN